MNRSDKRNWQTMHDGTIMHSVTSDDQTTRWRMMLQKVENFIRKQGGQQRPSDMSYDEHEKRLARWVHYQQHNYKNGTSIMKDVNIREEWAAFLDKHYSIFHAGVAAWRSKFQELVEFVREQRERGEERRLSRTSKDPVEKRLATWIANQQTIYVKNTGIMRNTDIREEWAAFVDANAALFKDNKAAWRDTLRNVEHFIEERGGEQLPSASIYDAYERRLASWIWHQRSNYANKVYIMKEVDIRAEWEAFVEKHDILFGEGSDTLRLLLLNFKEAIKQIHEFIPDENR
eukprot:6212450-Pleurochrysis_carterae.AAC.1